jgi:hypothetical protein
MYRFSGNKAVTPREAMYALVVYAHWGGLPECFGTNHKAISRAATMIADISTLLAF